MGEGASQCSALHRLGPRVHTGERASKRGAGDATPPRVASVCACRTAPAARCSPRPLRHRLCFDHRPPRPRPLGRLPMWQLGH
eukprot:6767650-Prymnesium_polylepis.1